MLFNNLPLHIFAEQSARMTAVCSYKQNLWNNKGGYVGHRQILKKTLNNLAIFKMPADNILPIWTNGSNYIILTTTREQWLASDNVYPPCADILCCTDGLLCELSDELTGLGVLCEQVPFGNKHSIRQSISYRCSSKPNMEMLGHYNDFMIFWAYFNINWQRKI